MEYGERHYTRTDILRSENFRSVAVEVGALLDRAGFAYCLIGGLAVAYHANPPVTVDVDFLVAADKKNITTFGAGITKMPGFWNMHPVRFGKPSPGDTGFGIKLKRMRGIEARVDLMIAGEDEYLNNVISNARIAEIQPGFVLKIATPEDLVVMKTLAGREKDLSDIEQLEDVFGDRLNHEYIDAVLAQLGFA